MPRNTASARLIAIMTMSSAAPMIWPIFARGRICGREIITCDGFCRPFVALGCIVAAGSVVTADCESNGLYAGVPVRRLRELETGEARAIAHV